MTRFFVLIISFRRRLEMRLKSHLSLDELIAPKAIIHFSCRLLIRKSTLKEIKIRMEK